MNKKLIAAAVSAAVMAPLSAQAQQDTTFSFMKMKGGLSTEVDIYGRINNAITSNKTGSGKNNVDLSGVASRFGLKSSTDLGNGLTASARYEFGTNTDSKANGIANTRIATVGLSGGFGSFTVGNQWSAYFDTVGTLISPTYTVGAVLYTGVADGPTRASNTIKYSNSAGPVYLEIDLRLNDSKDKDADKLNGEGAGIGLSFNITDNFIVAVAHDTEKGDTPDAGAVRGPSTDRTGIAARLSFGSLWFSLGHHRTKTDSTANSTRKLNQFYVSNTWGNTTVLLGYGKAEAYNTATSRNVSYKASTLGVYQNLGGGMTLYYEGTRAENTSGDVDKNLFGMRYDF